MLTLNINKLHNEVEEREKKKINTFEKVLDMCFKKILHSNQNYNDYNCVFAVPKFVFGLPLYNIVECCGFLIEKLIAKGFEVYLAIPTTLHISWKPKEFINTNIYTTNKPQLQYYNSHGGNIDTYSTKQIAIKNRNEIRNDNTNQKHNNMQYKPIEDYKQSNNISYDSNDLDLFKTKLDNLFD